MDALRRLLTVALMSATAMAMAACKAEEQDRVLYHEPGVYQGASDTPLADDKLDDLRQRALRQAG